jgi:hypothetical protein
VRHIRPPPNSSERIINSDLFGMGKVVVNHLQIASIECANAC